MFIGEEVELDPEDVRAARALLHWSQGDLAREAAVGVSTVAEFEKGSQTPTANNLTAIGRALEAAGVRFKPAGPTVFSKLSLYILTQADGTDMRSRYSLAGAVSVHEIIAVLGTVDGSDVNIDAVQLASPRLKDTISNLVLKHGAAVIPLNKLKKIVGSLQDGEHFLLLPAQPNTTADRWQVERFLHRLNNPSEQADDAGNELFGPLLAIYDMSSPRTDRRTLIGADRTPRKCRFCDRTSETGATFKKVAHVIPTALGNSFGPLGNGRKREWPREVKATRCLHQIGCYEPF